MDVSRRVVESGSASLAVHEWRGSGTTNIVALHPGVADARVWQWCAPVWAEAGHPVIAYDRRGFGETTCAPEAHDDVVDLRAVIDETVHDPAVLVGNSRGGGVALDFALVYPNDVAGLVLLAPSLSGYDYANWVEIEAEVAQDAQIAAAVERGDLEEVNRLELRYWLDGVEQPEGRVGGAPRALMHEMNAHALSADDIGEPVTRPDIWPRLEEIEVPTLVLVGALDLPAFGPQCRELATRLPDAAYIELPDSAHCPSLDDPDALNEYVLDFVARVGS